VQVLQFAIVAETSPVVDEDGNLPSNGGVTVASFSLAVMLIPVISLLI
jgi:hypothetical protein